MSEEDFFKFDKPLDLNAFNEEEAINPVRNAHVWHELGHLFAYCLVEKINYSLGKVISVQIGSKSLTKIDKPFYFKSDYIDEKKDCYGFKNTKYLNDPDDLILKAKVTGNPNLAKAKLIVLISGGLCNIFPFINHPQTEDFDQCYTNILDPKTATDYIGCAGNDWDKSRKIACCLNWSYEKLENFRQTLFRILKAYNVFDVIELIVKSIEPPTTIENAELKGLREKMEQLISNELEEAISELIKE